MASAKEEVYNKDGKLLGYWTAVSMNDDIDVVFMKPLEYKKYERITNKKTPEQIREYNKEFSKEYRKRPEVKERQRIRKQKYNKEHEDDIKERAKIYRENNKDKLNSKLSCECGSVYSYTNKNKHMKTIAHLKYMDKKPKN